MGRLHRAGVASGTCRYKDTRHIECRQQKFCLSPVEVYIYNVARLVIDVTVHFKRNLSFNQLIKKRSFICISLMVLSERCASAFSMARLNACIHMMFSVPARLDSSWEPPVLCAVNFMPSFN